MEYKDYKIAFTGAGSGGKTTLTNDWASETGARIIKADTKSFFPVGCKNHQDIIRLGSNHPELGSKFQFDVAYSRFNLFQSQTAGFVSDRSVVDSLAYYALHNSVFVNDNETDNKYSSLAYESTLNHLDLTFQLAPNVDKMDSLEDNGIRATSSLYFKIVSEVVRELLVDIMNHAGNYSTSVLAIDKNTKVLVALNDKTAVARLMENKWKNGIAPPEVRVEAIKKTLDFIKLNRKY